MEEGPELGNPVQNVADGAGRESSQPDVARPVGQEVKRVPEHHGLHVRDNLHLTLVEVDLGLGLDDARVANGQTVQQVHHDHDDEKDEGQKEEVAHRGLEGQIGELQLPDEHGEGLDDAEAEKVKESVFIFLRLVIIIILVEKDIESQGIREDKQRIPEISKTLDRAESTNIAAKAKKYTRL